jgi:hypothetical protein
MQADNIIIFPYHKMLINFIAMIWQVKIKMDLKLIILIVIYLLN